MIVCVCKSVSDKKIRQAALAKDNFVSYTKRTGCARQCGKCTQEVKCIFKEVQEEK